jgi:hypothetical protein
MLVIRFSVGRAGFCISSYSLHKILSGSKQTICKDGAKNDVAVGNL